MASAVALEGCSGGVQEDTYDEVIFDNRSNETIEPETAVCPSNLQQRHLSVKPKISMKSSKVGKTRKTYPNGTIVWDDSGW